MKLPNVDKWCWDGTPPRVEPSYVPILRPKQRERIVTIVLGDKIDGLWMHWIEGRSAPCFGRGGSCPGCECMSRRFWTGYLSVWLLPVGKHAIAQLPPVALSRSVELSKRDGELRCGTLVLERKSGSNRSPIVLTYTPCAKPLSVPPAIDLRIMLPKIMLGDESDSGRMFGKEGAR